MVKVPRIAVFEPEEKDSQVFSKLFSRSEYIVRTVKGCDDLLVALAEEGYPFDAAVIPLQLKGGSSGITTCLQLKAQTLLASIPIIGISSAKDPAITEAFYGAGADVVMLQPVEARLLYFQICALARQKRSFDEQVRKSYGDTGLQRSLISVFDTVRQGIVVYDAAAQAVFGNAALRLLLGLPQGLSPAQLQAEVAQFSPLIEEYRAQLKQADHSVVTSAYKECQVVRADRQSFQGALRISHLGAAPNNIVGFALSLSDLTEEHQLFDIVRQSERTRTLGLICAAGCRNLFDSRTLGHPTAPLGFLEGMLGRDEPRLNLSRELTVLLEILDVVMSSQIGLKVKMEREFELAVRPADFFQLIGHLLLSAAQHASSGGDVEISARERSSEPGTVSILITSRSQRTTPLLPNDLISRIIRGDLWQMSAAGPSSADHKLALGLGAAQAIADRYRSYVELKDPSANERVIRVTLPMVAG